MGADATSRLSVVNPAGDLTPTIVVRHFDTGSAPRKPGKNKEGCMSASNVSRRSFVTAAAAALGASAIGTATTTAFAEESATSYTFADTVEWAAQYDVVVLGMGFSGLVSAIAAADEGASVLICEKAPQGEEGGNSKVCGQMFAWAQGDVDSARTYYTALAAGRAIPDDMLEILASGVASMGDTLAERYGMDSSIFVNQKDAEGGRFAHMSPEYPEKPGSDVIGLWSTHETAADGFLYQTMSERLVANYADKIDVWYETPGTALIQDPATKTVVGVAVNRSGEQRNVRAVNGVCVCTGGFECDTQMVQDYLGQVNIPAFGGAYNAGDGVTMCAMAGARLWHLTAWEGANYIYNVESTGANAALAINTTLTTGGSILVGDGGRRYANETQPSRHGHIDGGNGIWDLPHFPEHIYVVFDQTQMDAVNEAGGIGEQATDTLVECASIEEAAEAIGCEAQALQKTIDDFNAFCEGGEDIAFGRDVTTMRPFDGTAYYVLPIRYTILNTQGGPQRNADCQIVDATGTPIPHLYGAGECGELTVCMYQGGTNVASCFIFGEIAGKNAAAAKDDLPAYEAAAQVESTPASLGDESDLA